MSILRSATVRPRPPNLSSNRLPIIFLATSFVILVCVSLIAVQTWLTWRARVIQLDETAISTTNLAQSVAQHAYDTIKEADTILVGLVERLEVDGVADGQRARIRALLVNRVTELPQLHGIFIYGHNGRWLVDSQAAMLSSQNNSDREHFIFHRDHLDRGPHIGRPVWSKSTDEWIFTVSRRNNGLTGSFAGFALATISIITSAGSTTVSLSARKARFSSHWTMASCWFAVLSKINRWEEIFRNYPCFAITCQAPQSARPRSSPVRMA
jgi:hypothetical protein